MGYKLVLFDLDGTLADTDFMIALTMHELYKEYRPGFKPSLQDMFAFSGPPLSKTMKEQFPDMDSEFMRTEFMKRSIKYYEETAKAYPYSRTLLCKIRKKGIKTGLITSKFRKAVDLTLNLIGLDNLFDVTRSGDEVEHNKPSPEGIDSAIEEIGIKDKTKVLYVGDSLYDYEAAKNAGVDFALARLSPRKLPPLECKFSFASYEEFEDELKPYL